MFGPEQRTAKTSYILLIGEKEVRLYEATSERISKKLSLIHLEDKEKLTDFLKTAPDAPLRILIHTRSLQFQSDPLPPLTVWDRFSYLRHKRELLGIIKDVRVLERSVVFSSFMKPSPWVQAWIQDLPVRHEGIFFYPLEIMNYGHSLDPQLKTTSWIWLDVCEEDHVEQIIYEKGRVLSSRLTKLPEAMDEEERSIFISKDITQALAYLKKKGTILPTPLEGFTSLPGITGALKLQKIPKETSFLKWWMTQNKLPWRFSVPRPAISPLLIVKRATVATLLLGAIASSVLISAITTSYQKSSAVKSRLVSLMHERALFQEQLKNDDIASMKIILSEYDDLAAITQSPLDQLEEIAQVLRLHQEIAITNFHWENQERSSLVLHIKAGEEDEDRDIVSDRFQDVTTALTDHFGKGNVTILKSPLTLEGKGLFSGSTNQETIQQTQEDTTGIVDVRAP